MVFTLPCSGQDKTEQGAGQDRVKPTYPANLSIKFSNFYLQKELFLGL